MRQNVRCLTLFSRLLIHRPPDAGSLAVKLQSRADVQARLASLTGYTPSKWLLQRELDQVEQRRANVFKPAPSGPGAGTRC